MTDKVFDNNQVSVAGEVMTEFVFSHDVFGEGFYVMEISVSRLSNSYDNIPVMVSERLMDIKENLKGKMLKLTKKYYKKTKHKLMCFA